MNINIVDKRLTILMIILLNRLGMRKICSINHVSIWPIGHKLRFFRKPFGEISLLFTERFISGLVIDWTNLKKLSGGLFYTL